MSQYSNLAFVSELAIIASKYPQNREGYLNAIREAQSRFGMNQQQAYVALASYFPGILLVLPEEYQLPLTSQFGRTPPPSPPSRSPSASPPSTRFPIEYRQPLRRYPVSDPPPPQNVIKAIAQKYRTQEGRTQESYIKAIQEAIDILGLDYQQAAEQLRPYF